MLVREGHNIVVMRRADERTFGITQNGKEINAVLDCSKAVQECVKEADLTMAAMSTVDAITFNKVGGKVDSKVQSDVRKMIKTINPLCQKFGKVDSSANEDNLYKDDAFYKFTLL